MTPGLPHRSQWSNLTSRPASFTVKALEVYKNLWKEKKTQTGQNYEEKLCCLEQESNQGGPDQGGHWTAEAMAADAWIGESF